jgi:hypothetical protein
MFSPPALWLKLLTPGTSSVTPSLLGPLMLFGGFGPITQMTVTEATGAKIEPGATVTFDLMDVDGPPSARPVSALVSIDPCFDPNQCLPVIGYGAAGRNPPHPLD